uniref:Transposase IS200-like domain-containing protein n=1 Tax=Chlorobium chlorochromatii (strain CaD3) TaxID=340177 RepID=Q3ARH7_CHLCH
MNNMQYNRRSIRLQGYDYSQSGAYFITICTQNRECLFGKIVDGNMILNDAGEMIKNIWHKIPTYHPYSYLDAMCIMPNHFHAIIMTVGADSISAPIDSISAPIDSISAPTIGAEMDSAPTLGNIVQTFKRYTTIEYIKMVKQNKLPSFNKRIWQRNYYEHIIRNESDYTHIYDYIQNNPQQWEMDTLYPNTL